MTYKTWSAYVASKLSWSERVARHLAKRAEYLQTFAELAAGPEGFPELYMDGAHRAARARAQWSVRELKRCGRYESVPADEQAVVELTRAFTHMRPDALALRAKFPELLGVRFMARRAS